MIGPITSIIITMFVSYESRNKKIQVEIMLINPFIPK